MTHDEALAFLGTWGYSAYFVLFLATAVGSPLTEDLLLLLGGYLIGGGVFAWPVTLPVAFAGVLATDCALYMFGRQLRAHSLRRGFVRRFIRPGRLRVATRWFARYGDWLVFLARLTPGTRIVVFVSAGLRGMSFWRFLTYDASASAIWVPALLWVGAALGQHIGGVNEALDWVGGRVILVVIAAALILVARELWLARAQRRTGDLEP